jgi:hypothetical protein
MEMDRKIPGLAAPSTRDWEYWVDMEGVEGYCYLEGGFDERLYCKLEVSEGDAFTMRTFDLYAYGCEAPIVSQRLTVPELEGCSEPESESESDPGHVDCTPGEQMYVVKETCEANGWDWDKNIHYCYCPSE